jgi:hypothetical protein
MRLAIVLLIVAAAAVGCFRTRYVNLEPLSVKPQMLASSVPPPSEWRSFFVYGWAPGELVIDAAKACGGIEHVKRIETEQTFLEGLVSAFAGYYINIYSPYNGAVICDDTRER